MVPHDIVHTTSGVADLSMYRCPQPSGICDSRLMSSSAHHQASLHFNINGVSDASRVAGLAWLPGSHGAFVAGHASGTIFFYQKKVSIS